MKFKRIKIVSMFIVGLLGSFSNNSAGCTHSQAVVNKTAYPKTTETFSKKTSDFLKKIEFTFFSAAGILAGLYLVAPPAYRIIMKHKLVDLINKMDYPVVFCTPCVYENLKSAQSKGLITKPFISVSPYSFRRDENSNVIVKISMIKDGTRVPFDTGNVIKIEFELERLIGQQHKDGRKVWKEYLDCEDLYKRLHFQGMVFECKDKSLFEQFGKV